MPQLRSPLVLSLLAGLLFWLALPPCEWTALAWLAPVPWILLVRQKSLLGKRPYLAIWIAGFIFWLAAVHWLVFPHWATTFGLIALAFYLAFYMPAFVWLARVSVERLRMPVIIAAPVVWVGLELVRSYMLTGFMMVVIGQTQYRWITLIQIADLAGTYGLSFLIVFVAACIAKMIPWDGERKCYWPAVPAIAIVALTLVYGQQRQCGDYLKSGPTVALIQGSTDTTLKADQSQIGKIFNEYYGLSQKAVDANPDLDLIVWPETMFRYSWFTFANDYRQPAGSERTPEEQIQLCESNVRAVAQQLGVPLILGVDTLYFTNEGIDRFNSALFVDRKGKVIDSYSKMHLVMFGEYVPFARRFPFLYKLTPLGSGMMTGKEPRSVSLDGVRYSPSICFESTLARVVRRQVRDYEPKGAASPDILVNLTNDGWFWGSAELDMHLICGVFRAVECRKPLLIAANTGFSGWIDSNGEIKEQGKRRQQDIIIANPQLDSRHSVYLQIGDLFAWICLALCVIAATTAIVGRFVAFRSAKGRVLSQSESRH